MNINIITLGISFLRGRTAMVHPPDRGAPKAPWPAILFLHGIAERGSGGDELSRVARWGLAKLRAQGLLHLDFPFPFLVVAPQCPPNLTWSDESVMAGLDDLINELVASGEADVHRIIIAGFSMGGYGAYDAALRWPNRFAGLVSVCGKCLTPERLRTLANLPQWVAWADDDEIEHLAEGSRQVVSELSSFGCLVARPYRVGAEGANSAHARTADAAFREPALYCWLRHRSL